MKDSKKRRGNFFVICGLILFAVFIWYTGSSGSNKRQAWEESEDQRRQRIVREENNFSVQNGDFFPSYIFTGKVTSPMQNTSCVVPTMSANDRIFVLGLAEKGVAERHDKFLVEYIPEMTRRGETSTVRSMITTFSGLEYCRSGSNYVLTRKEIKDAVFMYKKRFHSNYQDVTLVRQDGYMLS